MRARNGARFMDGLLVARSVSFTAVALLVARVPGFLKFARVVQVPGTPAFRLVDRAL